MAKELPYFRFTVQDWQNGKIDLERYELKGLFIDICGYYWINDCSVTLTMLNKKFSNATNEVAELVKLDIIKHEKRHDKVEIVFLNEQYDLLSEKRKRRQDAGSKGGNAKAMKKQKGSYKDNNKDNNKDKYNNKSIPPSLEDVKKYILERNNGVDPQKWYDHYTSNGWKVGRNPMKDWMAAIRKWEGSDFNKNNNKQPGGVAGTNVNLAKN